METVRVDISYRPLRIAWAIQAGDVVAFRRAVRMSHAVWGGRFNPIVVVDREEEARLLVEVFRVDVIVPIGDSDSVKVFEKCFPYLINPLFGDIFMGQRDDARAQVLDLHNALVHLRDTPEWKAVKDAGVLVYDWKKDDPLAHVFLMQLGSYPPVEGIGIDYRRMLVEAADGDKTGTF